MTLQLRINEEINKAKWENLQLNSDFSSPFQSYDYYRFYNSLRGYSADVFAIQQDEIILNLAVVTIQRESGLKALFSTRGIIIGGPLIRRDEESIHDLFEGIVNYYRSKLIYIEIRNYFNYSDYKSSFRKSGFKYIKWLNFHLNLSSHKEIEASISKSRMRQIRKAIKSGAKWKEAQNEYEVIEFYKILNDLYKNKIKKPLFPDQFFVEFYRQNLGKFLLIYTDNQIIGGIMCPVYNDKAIYEYFVCGLDFEFKTYFPSVMATWAAIEYGLSNNLKYFDFMGAGPPNQNYGVRDFKARFGGELVEYGRFILVLKPFMYSIGKLGLSLLQKLKI